jgi:hypothetical protein
MHEISKMKMHRIVFFRLQIAQACKLQLKRFDGCCGCYDQQMSDLRLEE